MCEVELLKRVKISIVYDHLNHPQSVTTNYEKPNVKYLFGSETNNIWLIC